MRLRHYILMVAVLFTVTSCDNFLDIQPVGYVVPHTASDYSELLTTAYQGVPKDRLVAGLRSDEVLLVPTNLGDVPPGFTSSYDMASYKDIWTWNDYSPDKSTTEFDWLSYYKVIYLATVTIEAEGDMEGAKQAVSQVVGEAYMLRAYMHFLLGNLYAPAYTKCDPATTKAVPVRRKIDFDEQSPRNTLAEVYQAVLEDITEAEKRLNVEKYQTGKNYRFTTLSVDALRSRVYLYMGKWPEAETCADNVIKKKKELEGTENVLENMNTSLTLPNNYKSIESIVSLEYNRAQVAGRLSENLRKLYTTSDQRRMKFYQVNSLTNFSVIKGGIIDYRSTLRMAEIYLNGAEAACRANDLTNARTLLLALVKNRFNATAYAEKETAVNAMTQDDLLNEILTERYRELAFEGHRWFDLRRTTQPAIERTLNGTTYRLEENDPRYTIRIPDAAIQANPNLQN